MVDESDKYWMVGTILQLGALNPTSNYGGIQHKKFESSYGTTEGRGLCVRSSSNSDKSPMENRGTILLLADTL